eukprot:TRINITY_DN3872_c1_g1_i1.p1 TRINITY_DN3872_c1_g1~~TRINITY_DN3872_c1_g1_i1.p1  ORF type:complete len:779 (+),score=126.66 TRINITY_DN3872_c1_g1_i1:76-2412(+)
MAQRSWFGGNAQTWDMPPVEPLSSFTGVQSLWKVVFREDDDREERRRKRLVFPALLVYSAVLGYRGILAAVDDIPAASGGDETLTMFVPAVLGAFFSSVVLLVTTVATQRLSQSTVDVFLIVQVLCMPLADWSSAAKAEEEIWPWGLVAVDIMYVLDSSDVVSWFGTGVLVSWIVVRSLEECERFGLLDWPADGVPEARGWGALPGLLVLRLVPVAFIINFMQGFSRGLKVEQDRTRASITAAEAITRDLQGYDVLSAAQKVQECADRLPLGLLKAFQGLLDNLNSYKPFLPHSCLPHSCDETEDEFEEGSPYSGFSSRVKNGGTPVSNKEKLNLSLATPAASAISPPVESLSASRNKSVGSQESRHSSASFRGSGIAGPGSSSCSILGVDLRRRNLSIIVGNLRNFLVIVRQSHIDQIHQLHCDLLALVVYRVQGARGTTDGMSGDRFTASLNGARSVGGHQLRAAQVAWGLTQPDLTGLLQGASAESTLKTRSSGLLGQCLRLDWHRVRKDDDHRRWSGMSAASTAKAKSEDDVQQIRPPLVLDDVSICTGVCSGEVLVGNVGCEVFRRFCFVGASATWAHAFERCSTRWRARVIVNGSVKADTDGHFFARLREQIVICKPGHSGLRPQRAWELDRANVDNSEPGEWMYQYDHMVQSDPWVHYNRAKEAHIANDSVLAGAHLRRGRAAAGASPSVYALYDELERELDVPEFQCLYVEGALLRAAAQRRSRAYCAKEDAFLQTVFALSSVTPPQSPGPLSAARSLSASNEGPRARCS